MGAVATHSTETWRSAFGFASGVAKSQPKSRVTRSDNLISCFFAVFPKSHRTNPSPIACSTHCAVLGEQTRSCLIFGTLWLFHRIVCHGLPQQGSQRHKHPPVQWVSVTFDVVSNIWPKGAVKTQQQDSARRMCSINWDAVAACNACWSSSGQCWGSWPDFLPLVGSRPRKWDFDVEPPNLLLVAFPPRKFSILNFWLLSLISPSVRAYFDAEPKDLSSPASETRRL